MSDLVEHWPLFGLRVRTPRIELRYPDDRDVAALAALAEVGIYDEGEPRWLTEWSDLPDLERARSVCQFQWRCRAETGPARWWLPFVVVVDGAVVGGQDIQASDFAVLREVSSGSWIGRAHRGRGIGTEMRAAVLHLAFDGLGAERAMSGARADNVRSIGVSRRNGYRINTSWPDVRAGERIETVDLVLDRGDWAVMRRDDIEIVGLAPCLPLLGLG